MLKLLLDADPIVYRSGYAAQHTRLEVIYESQNDGPAKAVFDDGDDMLTARGAYKVWKEAQGENIDVLREDVIITPEPVEFALHTVKAQVNGIENSVRDHFFSNPRLYPVLSGPGNYREKIATIRPYKGNRKAALPVHYNNIRNYLTSSFGAKVVHGRESDDEVSIQAYRAIADRDSYVVATIDKDLDQIPGWHYDYLKKVFYHVSEDDARDAFWIQVIAGDSSDNVPGAWHYGVERATGFVKLNRDLSDSQLWEGIVGLYENSKRIEGCPYIALDARTVARETAQLVYIQKEPGELWMPPGQPMGRVTGDVDD